MRAVIGLLLSLVARGWLEGAEAKRRLVGAEGFEPPAPCSQSGGCVCNVKVRSDDSRYVHGMARQWLTGTVGTTIRALGGAVTLGLVACGRAARPSLMALARLI